jgi:hypothetical protein
VKSGESSAVCDQGPYVLLFDEAATAHVSNVKGIDLLADNIGIVNG